MTVRAEGKSNEEKYYHVKMYVLEHEPERCLVKESNGCFMVDLLWLCKNLDLNLVINDSLFETDIYKAKQKANYYISQTKQGLEKTFADCKDQKKYTISKKNTDVKWTFSQGSDQGYAYSAYMGYIRVNLGTSVECETINGYEYNWVPLVPFLSIFDSAHLCENNELIIMPCAETVFDILHNSRTGRLFYAVDENSGHGEVVTQIKLFYNTFYKKVKSFFKNAVSFHWIKAFKNMTLDHSPYAEPLALELCRYNEEEMNEINLDCELRSEYACFLSDSIKELSELTSSGLEQKAQESARLLAELEKKLSATPYEYVSLKEYNEAMIKAAKTARDSKSFEPVHNAFTKASPVISVALAGAVEYITLSNEINSAQESSTDAVLTFLEYLDKESEVTLYTEIVDDLKKKAAMYDEKSTDFYENTAMSESIIEAVASEAGAQILDSYSGEMISSVARYKIFEGIGSELTSSTMLQLKAASLFWEIGELVANKLSGGAFDEMESFQLGFYTEMLEGDTRKVLSSFKDSMRLGYTDGMLDTYRQLEWVRLKSYYLARQNVMGSFKHYAKKSPEVYQTAFSEEMKDCQQLVHLMGILVSGNEGTTQKKLDECAKNFKKTNKKLLQSDVLTKISLNGETEDNSDSAKTVDTKHVVNAYNKFLISKYKNYQKIGGNSNYLSYAILDVNADKVPELLVRYLYDGKDEDGTALNETVIYVYYLDIDSNEIIEAGKLNHTFGGGGEVYYSEELHLLSTYSRTSTDHEDYFYSFDGLYIKEKYSLGWYGKLLKGWQKVYKFPDGSELTIEGGQGKKTNEADDKAIAKYNSYLGNRSEISFLGIDALAQSNSAEKYSDNVFYSYWNNYLIPKYGLAKKTTLNGDDGSKIAIYTGSISVLLFDIDNDEQKEMLHICLGKYGKSKDCVILEIYEFAENQVKKSASAVLDENYSWFQWYGSVSVCLSKKNNQYYIYCEDRKDADNSLDAYLVLQYDGQSLVYCQSIIDPGFTSDIELWSETSGKWVKTDKNGVIHYWEKYWEDYYDGKDLFTEKLYAENFDGEGIYLEDEGCYVTGKYTNYNKALETELGRYGVSWISEEDKTNLDKSSVIKICKHINTGNVYESESHSNSATVYDYTGCLYHIDNDDAKQLNLSDGDNQYNFNIYLSNFSEVLLPSFSGLPDNNTLISFGEAHNRRNNESTVDYNVSNKYMYRMKEEEIANTANKYFDVWLDESDFANYAKKFDGITHKKGYLYSDDPPYGFAYGNFTVVNKVQSIGNNMYRIAFATYPDASFYGFYDTTYSDPYHLSASEVKKLKISKENNGIAIIYASNLKKRDTYRLLAYSLS